MLHWTKSASAESFEEESTHGKGPWQDATGVNSDAATDCTALLSALPAASTESLNIFDVHLDIMMIILVPRKHGTFLDAFGSGPDP